MIHCKKCGTGLPDWANFCAQCGAKIDAEESAPVPNTVKATQKRKKKPVYKRWWFWSVVAIFLIAIISPGDKKQAAENDLVEATETNTDMYIKSEFENETAEQKEIAAEQEIPVGSNKDHPFVITANELANEINADTAAAKQKYNGKWVEITGEITGTSTSGFGYGYYLYGESTTTGYRGLRIMCWCDDLPYSETKVGNTHTFVGQVLEITTVNATEIVDCEKVE